ncbi:MAG TPA: FkbM family methyltransferase [Acidobacteriaceae bacterium]
MSAVSDKVGPLKAVLTEPVVAVEEREGSALDSLLRERGGRCVIFGAGTLGRKAVGLLREIGVEPLAVADSNPSRWGSDVAGVTVLSPSEAAARFGADAVFFVTIWNDFHWFSDTRAKLTALGCAAVSSYAPIFWRFGERFMDLRLLNEPPHKLYRQLDDVFAAEKLWADEESLATYRANIVWRALGDPSYLPFPAPENTYFPADLFKLIAGEALVDCGAFDGDTIRLMVSMVGADFKAVYAIEADTVSGAKLEAYRSSLPSSVAEKIHHLDCAVGARRCTLQFAMTGNATSKIEAAGVDVQCVPIDELFADRPVTLIKMDIEGAEYDALLGARKVIERDRPVLAICVYHTQSDVWRIPLLVQSMELGYKLFLRAYDGDGFQSVLYAVPDGRMLSEAERAVALRPKKSSAV